MIYSLESNYLKYPPPEKVIRLKKRTHDNYTTRHRYKNKMAEQFNAFLRDVLAMGYRPNGKNQHENAVEALLKKHGIPYQAQMNGTQAFPDFHIEPKGLWPINLECKSTKGTKRMWNRGLPKPNALYVVCSGRLNKTTIFWGRDVCPEKTYQRLLKRDQEFREMINKINKEEDDGWINYPRLAFDTRGPKAPKYFDPAFPKAILAYEWDTCLERTAKLLEE